MPSAPNWVDIIVLTIVLRACYNGINRGLFTEIINLVGALCVTALTINYAGLVTNWLAPSIWLPIHISGVLIFWGLFTGAWFTMRYLRKRITQIVKWERFHWLLQGMGLFLGGIRGLWWAGFVLLAIVSSGYPALQESVEARSATGPRVLRLFRTGLDGVANRFPGAIHRTTTLIPPLKPVMTP